MGYILQQGWLYDFPIEGSQYLIPVLPDGTTIELKKGSLTLRLTYDGKVPLESRFTDPHEIPLYVSATHNRPDTRLDVYQEDVYIGTLMVDFKYRWYKTFWDERSINSVARTHDMNQLVAYDRSCVSRYLFGRGESWFHDYNPVLEAWAVYPQKVEGEGRQMVYPDHKVRLIALSPGLKNEHLVQRLEETISQLTERYQWSKDRVQH